MQDISLFQWGLRKLWELVAGSIWYPAMLLIFALVFRNHSHGFFTENSAVMLQIIAAYALFILGVLSGMLVLEGLKRRGFDVVTPAYPEDKSSTTLSYIAKFTVQILVFGIVLGVPACVYLAFNRIAFSELYKLAPYVIFFGSAFALSIIYHALYRHRQRNAKKRAPGVLTE